MATLCNRSSAGSSSTKPATKLTTDSLFHELTAAWLRPLAKTCTAKDVARLSTRIYTSISTNPPEHPNSSVVGQKGEDPNNSSSNHRRTKAILTVVRQLSLFFQVDSEPAILNTTATFSETASDNPDLSSFVALLFDHLGGDSSPVVRCFKCCHQNILFSGIFQLKQSVLKDVQVKDSRTNDGWRIRISAEKGRVQVTHQRKEALIEVPGHVMWEMSLTFDGEMNKLCSTSLRLTGLSISDAAKNKDKTMLMEKLSKGKLILS